MRQSRVSHESFQPKELSAKEQWSIIYKHRAMQLEKAKSLQKIASLEQKDAIKRYLDEQVLYKMNSGQAEKKEDVKYYESIVQKVEQMNEKQQREKVENYLKRKQIEKYNRKLFEQALTPRRKETENPFNIDIGLKSELQKKQRAEQIRKDVLLALDKQKMERQLQRQRLRQKEMEQYRNNQAYQRQQFAARTQRNRSYLQNQALYNYYKDIYTQKMKKDKQLQQSYVDKAQQIKNQQEKFKDEAERMRRQRASLQMKDALQRQIQIENFRRSQEKNPNPEQASYMFMNSVFQDKRRPINKQEYSQFLEKQMQHQRCHRQKDRHMSEEEYKIHSSQLKMALSWNQTHQQDHNHSISTMGDAVSFTVTGSHEQKEANVVKNRLKSLKNQQYSSLIEGMAQIGINSH